MKVRAKVSESKKVTDSAARKVRGAAKLAGRKGTSKAKQPDHRYSLLVEWSDEDQVWIGRCPELMFGGVHGADRAEVYRELCDAVDEHIAIANEDGVELPPALAGKKFSGKFVLRIKPELHRLLALRAYQESDTLNNYVAKKLSA